MNKLKLSLAALSVSAALSAGPVVAAINWTFPTTLFEDDDIDFVLQSDLSPDANNDIDVGDVLVAVFELNDAGGSTILPEELAGLTVSQVAQKTATGTPGEGRFELIFQPYTGGMDAVLALGSLGVTVPGGLPGGGAMAAAWLSPEPGNLDISADDVVAGTVSCASLLECIDQATDDGTLAAAGGLWQVDGFTGGFTGDPPDEVWINDDLDEFWESPSAITNTTVALATQPALELGAVQAGLSIIFDGTGQNLAKNSISCFPFCLPGDPGDQMVDMLASGSVKGGLGLSAGLIGDGAVATSDFDIQKAIPEPSTLALLAAGFLGVGAAQRRRRKASGV